jgi:hypothetical protein
MAELGAIASIVGITAAGAKVSISLYDFASSVGDAGTQVWIIAIEISVFCSVLGLLKNTLAKAKSCRYSMSAIETAQEVLERCHGVFEDIDKIVSSLKNKNASAEPTVDFVARFKWTFKKSKVKLLRSTLESLKITLHIMLTTLDTVQKTASRR